MGGQLCPLVGLVGPWFCPFRRALRRELDLDERLELLEASGAFELL